MDSYWVLLALIPPILWAAINHADKYVIERYMQGRDPGSLIITTGGSAFLMFLVFSVIGGEGTADYAQALLMVIGGFFLALSYVPYMYALQKDEASNVAPLFQLITPLVFVLALIFLGETLTALQLFAGALIIAGALTLSVRFETAKFKVRTFLLMSLTALMIAANVVIFKGVAVSSTFWDAVRFDLVGVALAGLTLFLFVPKYREALYGAVKEHGAPVLWFNFIIETTNIGARLVNGFITLSVPAVLVQFVNGFQPVFIIVFGILLTKLFPAWGEEAIDRSALIRKFCAVFLMVLGFIILALL